MATASGKAFDWKLLKRLIDQSKPYRWGFRIALLIVVVSAFLGPVRPEIVQKAIDDYTQHGDKQGLLNCTLLYVAILIVEGLLQFAQSWYGNRVAQGVTLDLRAAVYRHVLQFRLKYFDKTPVGQLVTRHISDIDGIADVFSAGFLSIFGDILKLVIILVWMFSDNWKLSLIILIPIPILIYATRLFQRAVRKSFNDVRNEVSRINTFIQEHVTGMNIIQIFNQEQREKARFENINREHRNAHIRGIWAYSIFFPVVELLSAGSIALLLWWGIGHSMSGEVSEGSLMKYCLYIFALYRPIRQIADNFNTLQMGVVNAERVFKLLDTKESQQDNGLLSSAHFRGEVIMEDVWFSYDDVKEDTNQIPWVLRGVDLRIRAGEMVAFVGATGAGKTSMVNLLNRFYDFQKGRIQIDGANLSEYSLSNLRKNVGVVLQDVFLFSDTVFNNITLYNPSITEAQVIAASKSVGTHDFIMQLPGNYQYNVRERGAMLSAGQRQLLAFLRAYVQNPSILILDEATSSVDTESELLIQHAAQKLTEGRTSIVIAHRLSTIQRADRIVVLSKGKIIEQGTHNELLAMGGQYKRLFELQFSEFA
ncbi:MAG: ABC transporter ATP-binding protein [Flavobacteriales bacterium]|nr:ABC transporter ATP-binding protein [Flavobacteriales bacterium]